MTRGGAAARLGACALGAWLAGGSPLPAQVNLPPPPALDTTLGDLEAPSARWRQSLILRGTWRRYAVDERTGTDYDIAERAGFASYTVRGPRLSVRADLVPVQYTATPTGSPATSLVGLTPAQVRVDWRWRDGDTTRVYARSGTRPVALDTVQSQALGAAGTSTLDLDAVAFGAQAMLGVRQTLRFAVDDDNAISVRAAVEASPRPGGTEFAYWTGTTVRGGVAWQRALGPAASARLGADVARSFAEDLGGRNLFPGGGSVVLDARASGMLDGDEGRWFGAVQASWTRPFANPNADNLARLIPQGQFGGLTALVSADVGPVSIGPTLSLLRESSTADARFLVASPLGGRPLSNTVRKTGSGWSAAAGLSATWRVMDALELTLDGALTRGGVDLRETEQLRGPGGRPIGARETRRENGITGGWLALDVALRW